MDVNTGHLITAEQLAKLADEERARYAQVPPSLSRAARRALGGAPETTIDLTARTPLANWAAKVRKAKAKRKAARKSRARNRK